MGSCSRILPPGRLRLLIGASYSMILLALSRDGIAGVWGVCGEMGLPGEEAVDTEVPAIIAGTLDKRRLEEDGERWSIVDDETDSASPV